MSFNILMADNYVKFAKKDILHAFRSLYPHRRVQFIESKLQRPDVIVFFNSIPNAFKHSNIPKILFSGEPTDLSGRGACTLVVDCKDTPNRRPRSPRFSYYPFYVRSLSERGHNNARQLIKPIDYHQLAPTKTKFCAFLYSHDAEPRNQFFHMLSKYKQVDALGKAPTKFHGPRPQSRKDRGSHDITKGTYNDGAVSAYIKYKFVIAFENSSHPGYVTEKIINPMFAGAIPIYWGAPDVVNQFNEKSFINANGPGGLEKAVQRVIEIDQNPELYAQILQEPWLINNQLSKWLTNPSNYFTEAIRKSFSKPSAQKPVPQVSRRIVRPMRHGSRSIMTRPSVMRSSSVMRPSVRRVTRKPIRRTIVKRR